MASYTYYSHLSFKTRLLNTFRRIFTNKALEQILLAFTMGKKTASFWGKLIPPEYLYPAGTLRAVVRNGIKFELDLSMVVDHFLYFGTKDSSLTDLFTVIKKDFVIIDVGANIGLMALQFARAASSGKVIAFEPDPDNLTKLRKNISLNTLVNLTVVPCGLGAFSETVKLYMVDSTNPGMNRVLKNANEKFPFHEINIVKLDDEISERNIARVDLIKIDVEGYEMNVLKGALRTIQQFKPLLFIEVDDQYLKEQQSSALELVQYIKSFGYAIYKSGNNKPVNETDDLIGCHFDVFCRPV